MTKSGIRKRPRRERGQLNRQFEETEKERKRKRERERERIPSHLISLPPSFEWSVRSFVRSFFVRRFGGRFRAAVAVPAAALAAAAAAATFEAQNLPQFAPSAENINKITLNDFFHVLLFIIIKVFSIKLFYFSGH